MVIQIITELRNIYINIDHFKKEVERWPNQKHVIQFLRLKKKNNPALYKQWINDTDESISELEDKVIEMTHSQ